MINIRLACPWGRALFALGPIRVSPDIPLDQADALLCEWEPTRELLTFDGPKAWYCCEPSTNPRMGIGSIKQWQQIAGQLENGVWLYHAHPDPQYRFPATTHRYSADVVLEGSRAGAVAVVSNFGGEFRRRWPDVQERNTFVTHPLVDLYGLEAAWRRYRESRWAWRQLPTNYRGTADGNWGEADKWRLLSNYKVAVCLENTQEPFYFTEKFVDAVLAGCIPVYRAHPTVRDGILKGAFWVDPADHDSDAEKTLQYALSLDRPQIAEQNKQWFESDAVAATRRSSIFSSIAVMLAQQVQK